MRVTLWVTRDQLRLASQLMGFNKVLEGLMLQSFQLPTSCRGLCIHGEFAAVFAW